MAEPLVPMRIALLEDDPDQGALLKAWLEEDRHLCHHFKSAEDLKRALNRESFDLLLLDWLLPESSGIEVLQWVRNRVDWRIPVIFITRKDTDEDVVYALEQGADDYIAKPVSRPVALARVHAIERRVFREKGGRETLESGNIGIDVATGSVTKDGVPVTLTDREAKLAAVLFSNIGRLLSRNYLLETVWGIVPDVATRTVDTHISRLRQKLELFPEKGWQLKAIYQHGYRLERAYRESEPQGE